MDKKHRDLLRTNYRFLGDQFSDAIEDICAYLFEKDIIKKPMKQDIMSKPTETARAYRLLDVIVTRGPDAFEYLYKASLEAELFKAADVLREENRPHEPPVDEASADGDILESDSVKKPPPEYHPEPSKSFIEKALVQKLEVLTLLDKKTFDKHIGNPDIYQMKNKSRGVLFILHDGKIPTGLDRRVIENVFKGMNFNDLCVKTIVSDEEVENKLVFQESPDCVVLFTFASSPDSYFNNGGKGLTKIAQKLKNDEILVGVPKLIFHVTRRTENKPSEEGKEGNEKKTVSGGGDGGDKGLIPVPDDNTTNPPVYSNPGGDPIAELSLKRVTSQSQPQQKEDETTLQKIEWGGASGGEGRDTVDAPNTRAFKLPKDADMMIIEATDYGCEVLEAHGYKLTRFIYLIADTYSQHAKTDNLIELIRKMNTRSEKDVAECSGSLRLKLSFFPGHKIN